jgi:para-aminobenzoate synthetase
VNILLIDNYDSYTYNLFQLFAQVSGEAPTVLVNDDPRIAGIDPATVDAVVISPGPGRPQHATDLGWCGELLTAYPHLPVLGVCLGHQTIAYAAGAKVVEGTARHGHLSRIRHDGRELYAGIPQDFTAVRYHSLAVAEPVPAALTVTARAEDGTVMGVRHNRLPRWGVQFHPESIATEHGAALVRNFLDLVRTRSAPAARPPSTPAARPPSAPAARPPSTPPAQPDPVPRTDESFTATTTAPPEPVAPLRILVGAIDRELDGARVFTELFGTSPYAFWLDASLVEPGRSRFSFLGDAAGPLAERLTYRVGTGEVRLTRGTEESTVSGDIFEVLRARLAGRRAVPVDLPFDHIGYVGYLGYEVKADCGGTNAHTAPTPDAAWLFADRFVAIDHEQGRTYLVAATTDTGTEIAAGQAWIAATTARISGLAQPSTVDVREPEPDPAGATLARDRDRYLADIARCADELRRGESYEICLTNQLRLPAVVDPLEYYLTLRRLNPAPHAAFLRFGEVAVLSSSPERFLRVDTDGLAEIRPIKGTAPRHADPATDERLRASLAGSAKTYAENLMIVDLVRHDLGRVCEVGSVAVPRFMATETYPTLHQLVSTVQGRLRPEVDAVQCARACFPAGSMTGAPKIRTMEIIDRLEGAARGIYSGALGYFGLAGSADLSVVIRTAVVTPDAVRIGAGGAIVLDSEPADEFDEAMLKAAALIRAHRVASRLSH